MSRQSAIEYQREKYHSRLAQGLCVACASPSPRYSYCIGCRRARNAAKRVEQPNYLPDVLADILRLYCEELLPATAVARHLRRKPAYVYDRVYVAGVMRAQGVGISKHVVPWIDLASEQHGKVTLGELARRYKMEKTSLRRTIQRYRDASQDWVLEAFTLHRQQETWSAIARTMRRDEEDVRVFVSRRAAYVRHKQEMRR